jgi:hypothetical protein
VVKEPNPAHLAEVCAAALFSSKNPMFTAKTDARERLPPIRSSGMNVFSPFPFIFGSGIYKISSIKAAIARATFKRIWVVWVFEQWTPVHT